MAVTSMMSKRITSGWLLRGTAWEPINDWLINESHPDVGFCLALIATMVLKANQRLGCVMWCGLTM